MWPVSPPCSKAAPVPSPCCGFGEKWLGNSEKGEELQAEVESCACRMQKGMELVEGGICVCR